jgi:hypothetical protein
MVTRRDYEAEAVAAAHSVLLELVRTLGAFHDDIVLVGGYLPYLRFSVPDDPHVGSLDIDLALNHRSLATAAYDSILQLLAARGYRPHPDPAKAHTYLREVAVGGHTIDLEIDLLAGEYGGRGRGRRHQIAQGVTPRKARGCDLAFEAPVEQRLEGVLPDGGRDQATVRLAAIVPFLVMKAMALATRLKEKDAYDIDYCLRYYRGGIEAVAKAFGPLRQHGLVQEALGHLAEKFAAFDSVGPTHVVTFREIDDPEARAIEQRAAHARVQRLLALVREMKVE